MTPIFIISYNRYTVLKKLVDRLIGMGQERIVVVDNRSTYEPLLQYYNEEIRKKFDLVLMPDNFGHNVLRRLFKNQDLRQKYGLDKMNFIYTDADVIPSEECPSDFVQRFNEILARYFYVAKVGFGLRIDDLPDSFDAKQRLIKWESQFWRDPIHDIETGIDLYMTAIDTTFACQRAGTSPGWAKNCFRTGPPYIARHLPWYIDSKNLSEEDQFYMKFAGEKETHFPGRYFKEPEI